MPGGIFLSTWGRSSIGRAAGLYPVAPDKRQVVGSSPTAPTIIPIGRGRSCLLVIHLTYRFLFPISLQIFRPRERDFLFQIPNDKTRMFVTCHRAASFRTFRDNIERVREPLRPAAS